MKLLLFLPLLALAGEASVCRESVCGHMDSRVMCPAEAVTNCLAIVSPTNGERVAVLNAANKAFAAAAPSVRAAMIRGLESRARMLEAGSRPESLKVEWRHALADGEKPPASYLVTIRRKADGRLFLLERVTGHSLDVCNFEIGCDYELRVSACDAAGNERAAAVRSFATEDLAPRVMSVEDVRNVRDLGGWRVADGRRIRQGLVYRSQAFNDNVDYVAKRDPETGNKVPKPECEWRPGKIRGTPESRRACRLSLGIRTEIDLRRPENETWHVTESPLGRSVRYLPVSGASYGRMGTDEGKARFARIFRAFTDRRNYPISFHCIAGADRTGSLAYVLGALLGMSEEDLSLDYYFTCFANAAPWPLLKGEDTRYRDLCKVLAACPGKTLAERAEAYASDCGVSAAEVAAFRKIMLEESSGPEGCEAFAQANEKTRREMAAAVPAVRDLGGRRAMAGTRLRYRRLVRTDRDVRQPGREPFGGGVADGKKCLRRAFDRLLDRPGRPIALPCAEDAERTGALVALIELLMGVDEDDVSRDWQLTVFFNGRLKPGDTRYDSLLAELSKFSGRTWREKAEAYAKASGVSEREIAQARDWLLESPVIEMGVLSDTHICGERSLARGKAGFNEGCRRAFAWFSREGVDVVVNAGDVTEGGNLEELGLYRQMLDEAFPKGRCLDGRRKVEHVSVWGNHDMFDASYMRKLDMTAERPTSIPENHARATKALDGVARAAGWFDRTVHGVRFVGVDWKKDAELTAASADWLKESDKEGFLVYLRHSPREDGGAWARLSACGDALRLSGHNHMAIDNPKAYSSDRLPLTMLCGSTMTLGHLENGFGVGRLRTKARHASIVRVWSDRVTVERRELFNDEPLGDELTFPRTDGAAADGNKQGEGMTDTQTRRTRF